MTKVGEGGNAPQRFKADRAPKPCGSRCRVALQNSHCQFTSLSAAATATPANAKCVA